jgi:hypothetical protein
MKEGEKVGPEVPGMPPLPPGEEWRRWQRRVRVAFRDLEAVTKDRLRRKRKRDLGIREAKRLYREARDTLESLLALAGGGDDGGDEGGGDPAGLGGSPGE